ncbi:hypothetical protein E0K89_011485 [Aquicoccus sp. SCR17]|nr:hypothetical protein [Carideicomes alvinocaridis]
MRRADGRRGMIVLGPGQRGALSLLAIVTGGVYAVLLFIGLIMMTPEAQGLMPLDARIGGYDSEDVREFLAALSEYGRWLYLGPVRLLDTVFPPLFGLLLALLIAVNGRLWLSPVPFLYAAVDLWENAVVAGILRSGDARMAPTASNLTQGKFALVALSLAILWLAWRGRRRRIA